MLPVFFLPWDCVKQNANPDYLSYNFQAGIQNNPAINRNNLSATANSRLPPPATIPKKSSLSSTPSPSESSSNNSNSSSNKKAAPASQASSRPGANFTNILRADFFYLCNYYKVPRVYETLNPGLLP